MSKLKNIISWILFAPYAAMMVLGPAFCYVVLALVTLFAAGLAVGFLL